LLFFSAEHVLFPHQHSIIKFCPVLTDLIYIFSDAVNRIYYIRDFKNGALNVMSQDQPYYQEFRDLLARIQSAVTDLKKKNERLADENREFSSELKEVRGQLASANREIDRLNIELAAQTARKEPGESAKIPSDTGSGFADSDAAAPTRLTSASPSLFDNLDDNEKRILRQQIIELIARIDKHLNRAGINHTTESS